MFYPGHGYVVISMYQITIPALVNCAIINTHGVIWKKKLARGKWPKTD